MKAPYTDPRWDPAAPGLRSDTCAMGEPGIAPSTITPPPRAEDPDERRHREVMTVLKLIGDALGALSEGLAETQAAVSTLKEKTSA